MRKRIKAAADTVPSVLGDENWLDLDRVVAEVEVSSEDPGHPVENALLPGNGAGWRAGAPGPQTIRLCFAQPQRLRRIAIVFEEHRLARTQEFCLRWSATAGGSGAEIVRQQWNFSPEGAPSETEDYRVVLEDVSVLDLEIIPDVAGGSAVASLARLRLA